MHNKIKKLADIISTHDLSQIGKQLRIIAISQGKLNSTESNEQLESDKKLFLLARAFLTKHGQPNENWRTSVDCFEKLSDWFEADTTIENHLQLSMISWYCQLDHLLSNAINPRYLITFGSAYYAEPHRFMGFLYWLITNDVPAILIIRSNILHQFFSYHCFEMATIEKCYALLANLSENLNHFLTHLEKITCGMRGFINNLKEDQTYYSHNLLGKFFTHDTVLPEQNRSDTHTTLLESICINYAEQLFYLFEWELIRKLNHTHQINQDLLKKLLRSETKTKILNQLPSYTLDGQLSTQHASAILYLIGMTYNPEELLAITLSEPFYFHAARLNFYEWTFEPHFANIINMLCTNTKYHTLTHLPFLVSLSMRLTNNIAQLDLNWDTVEVNLILNTIINIILPYGNTIHDSAIRTIHPILNMLTPFFRIKLSELTCNIETAVQNLNRGEIDYETLKQLWGSQLSSCNLIFYLFPNFSYATSYPRSTFGLNTLVLQKKCAFCIATNEPFQLEQILSSMTPDPMTQKRILQETLIHPSSQTELIKVILDYETPQFSCDALLSDHFGQTISVLFHAFTTENYILQTALLRRADIHEHILEIIKIAASNNLIQAFNLALLHIQLNETHIIKIIRHLLSCFDKDSLTNNVRNFYFSKIFFLLEKLAEAKLPEGILTRILDQIIKYEQITFLKMLCNLTGTNKLTPNEINFALFDTGIRYETWGAIAYLCGLSGDETNPLLITNNNIALYFEIINKYKTHYHTNEAPKKALQYRNNRGESLLYLAANHHTFEQVKTIFDEIRNCYKHEPGRIYAFLNTGVTLNQIITCESNHPEKDKINAFLKERYEEYKQYEENTPSTETDSDESDDEENTATFDLRNRFFSNSPNRRTRSLSTESEQDEAFNSTWPR